jgi:hypothetical protein
LRPSAWHDKDGFFNTIRGGLDILNGALSGNGLTARADGAQRPRHEADLQLDIIVPVIMGCALLWWVSREIDWTTRLTVTAITCALIIGVLLFERLRY